MLLIKDRQLPSRSIVSDNQSHPSCYRLQQSREIDDYLTSAEIENDQQLMHQQIKY